MPVYHKTLLDRFGTFPQAQQILMICNELNRAESQVERFDYYQHHIILAMELMDFLIRDKKWQPKYKEILRAREMLGQYYLSSDKDLKNYTDNLIKLSPEAFRMLKPGNKITNS
ncbi:MAG: hypothetical protein Q7J65_07595 [Candidatus Marinimicrobia bacterium]|nr:hypothetical protein [Candidatus Neomarinimicrobiota bacterium]